MLHWGTVLEKTSSSIFPMAPDDGIARQKHNMYLDAPKSILLANS